MQLRWSGSDGTSGLAGYDINAAGDYIDGEELITTTTTTSWQFTGTNHSDSCGVGHDSGYYVVARDNRGNSAKSSYITKYPMFGRRLASIQTEALRYGSRLEPALGQHRTAPASTAAHALLDCRAGSRDVHRGHDAARSDRRARHGEEQQPGWPTSVSMAPPPPRSTPTPPPQATGSSCGRRPSTPLAPTLSRSATLHDRSFEVDVDSIMLK